MHLRTLIAAGPPQLIEKYTERVHAAPSCHAVQLHSREKLVRAGMWPAMKHKGGLDPSLRLNRVRGKYARCAKAAHWRWLGLQSVVNTR